MNWNSSIAHLKIACFSTIANSIIVKYWLPGETALGTVRAFNGGPWENCATVDTMLMPQTGAKNQWYEVLLLVCQREVMIWETCPFL